MKKLLPVMIAVGLLMFASSALSQEAQINFTGWDGSSWDGGGTGFYYGSVNGTNVGPAPATSPGYFCDDFSHEISLPESWSANAFQVSNLLTNWNSLGGSTVYGSTIGLAGYTEMAILVEAAFSGTLAGLDGLGATADQLSEVLWCIDGGPGSACSKSAMGNTAYSLWQWVLSNHSVTSYSQFANLWLYVPIPGTQTGTLGTPQEMWGNVPVPEGGSALLYLLLAGVSCFAAMFFRSRQQTYPTT